MYAACRQSMSRRRRLVARLRVYFTCYFIEIWARDSAHDEEPPWSLQDIRTVLGCRFRARTERDCLPRYTRDLSKTNARISHSRTLSSLRDSEYFETTPRTLAIARNWVRIGQTRHGRRRARRRPGRAVQHLQSSRAHRTHRNSFPRPVQLSLSNVKADHS